MSTNLSSVELYLNKYSPNTKLVSETSNLDLFKLPLAWTEILKAQPENRIESVLRLWKDHFAQELSLTITTLERQLKAVHVIEGINDYSLLYQVENEGELYFYIGSSSYSLKIPNKLEKYWSKIDSKIQQFYTRLHNGWYFLPSLSLGLLPSNEFFTLDEKEWGILEDIDSPIDLEKTVAFFHNGSGGYLCINFEEDMPRGVVWWKDEEPTIGVNFWDYLDEWINIGLEN